MLLGIAGISQDEVPQLTRSMLRKVVPRMKSTLHNQKNELALVSDFIKYSGVENLIDDETADRYRDVMKTIYRWIGEKYGSKSDEGRSEPFPHLCQLSNTGIIASNLGIKYDVDPLISDVMDFELHHTDYEGDLKCGHLPVLDMLYFAKLNGMDKKLMQKKAGNKLDERCAERENVLMTKETFKLHLGEMLGEDCDKVYKAMCEGTTGVSGVSSKGDDGKEYYLGTKPVPPRKLLTPEKIRKIMTLKLGNSLPRYCSEKDFMKAVDIIYRHNRVKDFFGAELPIPEKLTGLENDFFADQTPGTIKRWLNGLVASYRPDSLSYSIDLPENMTKNEYALMRIMELSGQYLRMTNLVYDTPEKRKMMQGFSVPAFGINGV